MKTKVRFLNAYIKTRLLYSVQACSLSAVELANLESIWYGFLRKMVRNGFKRKGDELEYLKKTLPFYTLIKIYVI